VFTARYGLDVYIRLRSLFTVTDIVLVSTPVAIIPTVSTSKVMQFLPQICHHFIPEVPNCLIYFRIVHIVHTVSSNSTITLI
jgi:hypothetical protein